MSALFFAQRASGQSTGEITCDTMTTDAFVEDIEAVRQAFKLETVTLLGHSWRTGLSMLYATAHPESVNKLILLNPMPVSLEENIVMYAERSLRLSSIQEELIAIEQSQEFITEQDNTLQPPREHNFFTTLKM